MFQSPSGVLGVCRQELRDRHPELTAEVSVPFRGFRGLQDEVWSPILAIALQFQSPSGVLGVCRADRAAAAADAVEVSVPFRGFRGLQALPAQRNPFAGREVSVPFRGFRGLQVHGGSGKDGGGSRFSPLPGF